MSNLIPLPGPLCSATIPGGDYCPRDSSATVKVEDPCGISLLVWRCPEHIAATVDDSVRSCPDAVITITPHTAAEPHPQPEQEASRPLCPVSG